MFLSGLSCCESYFVFCFSTYDQQEGILHITITSDPHKVMIYWDRNQRGQRATAKAEKKVVNNSEDGQQ